MHSRARAAGTVVLWLNLSVLACAAEPFASDWSPSAKSRARLVADAAGAGLQIELAPGAITYWRNPGEAGVPPAFDFSGSENLALAEVDFPAPERIAEADGTDAFGYRGAVVLPIRVTAADPAKPVKLALKADYGVCEKICLPARATARLTLPVSGASAQASALAQGRAAVPAKKDAADLGAKVEALGPKAWRLCLAERPRDLFLEAPDGYWIGAKREADARCFALTQEQAPEGGKPPVEVRLTVEGDRGAAEAKVALGG